MRRLACVAALIAVAAACSEPPTKEREQAQGAIEAARAAGAATYAATDLKAAETALAGYDAAVSERDYRLALSLAIDAREGAYAAARRAADEKVRVRTQALESVGAVENGVAAIEQRLNGKSGPRPSRPVAQRLNATVESAKAALQKARSRVEAEDYQNAVAILTPVRKAIDTDLAALAPARGRSGR